MKELWKRKKNKGGWREERGTERNRRKMREEETGQEGEDRGLSLMGKAAWGCGLRKF